MRATQLIGGVSLAVGTKDADFTLAITDAGNYIRVSKATDVNVTVPKSTTVDFPVGTTVVFEQVGAGKAVLTPAVDVTINVLSTKGLNTAGTSAVATLVKVDVDTWVAYGDLAA